MLAYAAAKGGMEMLTRTLAEEWGERGIRVNSLAPDYIETEMGEGLRSHPEMALVADRAHSAGPIRRPPRDCRLRDFPR